MEEQALALQLQHSRERLRAALIPETGLGDDSGRFPRSAVMRILVDSGKRKVAFTVLSSLLMLVARRRFKWLAPGIP